MGGPLVDITTAMASIATMQAGLAITSPVSRSVKRAFTFPPNRQQALADTPCWINGWQLARIEWGLGGTAGPRHEFYTVHSQLFVLDADLNRGASIASAFLPAFLVALNADWTLGGTVVSVDCRGGDPTLGLLEWAGQGYPGLDLYLDVEVTNNS